MKIIKFIIKAFQTPWMQSDRLYLAPLVIPAVMAGVEGLANLFSGSAEEDRINNLRNMLKMREGQISKDTVDAEGNLRRGTESTLKKRRVSQNQKAAQEGKDPLTANYSNEADIQEGLQNGLTNLQTNKVNALNSLKSEEMNFEANAPLPESGIEKFMKGVTGGANLGFNINSAAGIGGVKPGAGTPPIGTPGMNVNSPIPGLEGIDPEKLHQFMQLYKIFNMIPR